MKGRTRKQQIGIITAMVVGVFALSIGFAAFSSTLNIRSSATVNPDASSFAVIFSNDGNNVDATQTVNPSSETYGDSATITNGTSPVIGGLKAKFTAPGQSVSYSFYAKNTGSFDAYLNYITFLNAENATSNKVCTAQDGTDQTLVDQACAGISISVKVGQDAPVTTSQAGMTNHMLGKNTNEQVIVTITYAENAMVADGAFEVLFGNISLIYSTVSDYVAEHTGPICTPVEVATTGNVPSGNYTAGDEYMCEVKPGVSYRFFVLNSDADNVNLQMYANINDDGVPVDSDEVENKGYTEWLTRDAYEKAGGNDWDGYVDNHKFGPITALEYLNKATSTWTNIDDLNETINVLQPWSSEIAYTINLTGKARLAQVSELSESPWVFDYISQNGPSNIAHIINVSGYWLMDAGGEPSYGAENIADGISFGSAYTAFDTPLGVRPVIKVAKSKMA